MASGELVPDHDPHGGGGGLDLHDHHSTVSQDLMLNASDWEDGGTVGGYDMSAPKSPRGGGGGLAAFGVSGLLSPASAGGGGGGARMAAA